MLPPSVYPAVEFGSLLARYAKTHHVLPRQFDFMPESFLRRFLERFLSAIVFLFRESGRRSGQS
jgi:hypothetical protein